MAGSRSTSHSQSYTSKSSSRPRARPREHGSHSNSSVSGRSSSPSRHSSLLRDASSNDSSSLSRTSGSSYTSPSQSFPSSDDDDGSDEEEVHRDGKRRKSWAEGNAYKKPRKDPASRHGRHFSRTVDMWRRFAVIIEAGTRPLQAAEVVPPDPAFVELFKELQTLFPNIQAAVKESSIEEVAKSLENARANARGEDIKRLNDNIHRLRTFEPALPSDKSARGFHNSHTARLLVPATKVLEWETDQDFRTRLTEGREEIHPCDYPAFLYENEKVDISNLQRGFLRNEILVKAFRMIFLGPSAVDGRGTSARATKKGNAMLNNMKRVTIASIAYVATLVYHVLSSQSTFCAGGEHGKFNYHLFYTSMVDLYKNEKMTNRRKQLLEWWDSQVFLKGEPEMVEDASTVYARMLEQLKDDADVDL